MKLKNNKNISLKRKIKKSLFLKTFQNPNIFEISKVIYSYSFRSIKRQISILLIYGFPFRCILSSFGVRIVGSVARFPLSKLLNKKYILGYIMFFKVIKEI
jgi:hypothetical protein